MAEETPGARGELMLMPWWRSFVFRFVGTLVATVVALIGVGIYQLHKADRREVEDKFGLTLESIAGTAAPFISADDVEAIHTNADVPGPAFQSVRRALERIRHENELREDQVYILRPSERDPNTYTFVAMLQSNTFVGDVYRPPPRLRSLYRWSREHHDAVRTALYTDAHGSFVSGIAPVADASGRVVALLQVDYDLKMFLAEVDRRTEELLAGALAMVVAIVVAGLWTHHRLRRKVLAVLGGTRAIVAEQYDHRVVVAGMDEIAELGTALNHALEKLKERFEMLRFLPRHTRRMIHDASMRSGRVSLSEARRVRVVVMESDIRGFSTLSENLRPEKVIEMLNQYIRVQAEIVEQAGGSIDKFMGDAVLAVFEGEGMERRAVECALVVQRAVQRKNDELAFEQPVHVGVGLSVGEVVMGNMGSEDRMEHTVIGAVVNLAARLCSAAGPDEVVLPRELWSAAGDVVGAHASEPEAVRVKGFEQPIACVRLKLDARASVTEVRA